MSLPFGWDFLPDNLPQERLAELRRRFMEEWRSGGYTRKEMIERYRMSERTFWFSMIRERSRTQDLPILKRIFQIRSDGGSEFDNNDVNDFFDKNSISWTKVSKPWDNPFAERGIRTIKHEYLNQVWIGNYNACENLCEIIKSDYNECRPHQSFDNKTSAEIRIVAAGGKHEILVF